MPRAGLSSLGGYAWADACLRLSPTSLALRQALCSLTLSSIGCQQGNNELIRRGAECYGAAILRLNGVLESPQAAAKDESVIPTCMLLSIYEVSLIDSFQKCID